MSIENESVESTYGERVVASECCAVPCYGVQCLRQNDVSLLDARRPRERNHLHHSLLILLLVETEEGTRLVLHKEIADHDASAFNPSRNRSGKSNTGIFLTQ